MSSMTRVRSAAWLGVVLLGLTASACAGPDGGTTGAADCTSQIRSKEAVFSSYGSTRHAATEYGVALEAVCEDVGEDARGSVFTDESRQVPTYRFADYPPSQVLGVRQGSGQGLAVFVADSVAPEERDRIYAELGRPEQ